MMFEPARMVRQNNLDFRPPEPNPIVQRLFKMLLPFICGQVLTGLSIDIKDDDLARLKALRGQRCLILPNHPSEWDPCVLFDVAKRLNENFFFVAAREVFEYSYGLRGWFFQKLGVYSLVRGSNDRKSIKTSIDTLSQNKGRLVIFIEGEISNQNETLLPLESGVIQLAFMALSDLYKSNGKDLSALPSLYICPVGLRYDYEAEGLEEAVEHSVRELEEAVGIAVNTGESRYERMQFLASTVLMGAAGQLGYSLKPDVPMAQNVQGLSGFMLQKLEQVINLDPDPAQSQLDRIRQVRNTVDKILSLGEQNETNAYGKRLFHHQKAVLRHFYEDLDRVVNFIAIYDGYLQPEMGTADYVEILRRLEKEVFGNFKLVHPRKACVSVQEPIDLKNYFADFLADKKATVEQLAVEVERKIYTGIQQNKGVVGSCLG